MNRNKLQQQQQQQQTPATMGSCPYPPAGLSSNNPGNSKTFQQDGSSKGLLGMMQTTSNSASLTTPAKSSGPVSIKDVMAAVGNTSRKDTQTSQTFSSLGSVAVTQSPASAGSGRPRIHPRPLLREPRLCLDKKQRCVICSVEKGAAGHLLQEYDQLICKVCFRFFSKFVRVPLHLR